MNKECLTTCVPKFERKNKSYRCSSPVVSKMYPRGGERSGSKSTMVLHCAACFHLVSPFTRLVRDGVFLMFLGVVLGFVSFFCFLVEFVLFLILEDTWLFAV